MLKRALVLGIGILAASTTLTLMADTGVGRQLTRSEAGALHGKGSNPDECCFLYSLCCPTWDKCPSYTMDQVCLDSEGDNVAESANINCCCFYNPNQGYVCIDGASTNNCLIEVFCTWNSIIMKCSDGATNTIVSLTSSCSNQVPGCPSPGSCN